MKKSEITFVVQGGVNGAENCITSIRKFFPESKIILSTWSGADVAGMDYDTIILNEDPGAKHVIATDRKDRPNNINRQIISTLAGLKAVKTKYAVKIRTDFWLKSDAFFQTYKNSKLKNFDSSMRFLKQRVFLLNLFYCDIDQNRPYFYHFSDLFHFGLTQDLLKIWDIPFMSEADQNYFKESQAIFQSKYLIEQHILLEALKKNKINFTAPINYRELLDKKDEATNCLISNFMLENHFKIGIGSKFKMATLDDYYTKSKFLKIYKSKTGDKNILREILVSQVEEFFYTVRRKKWTLRWRLRGFLRPLNKAEDNI